MPRLIVLTGVFDSEVKQKLRLLLLEGFTDVEIGDQPNWRKVETRPDLVIVGGFDDAGAALSRIRSIRLDFPGVPVILITNRGSENLAAACIRLAIQDYFPTPVGWEELLIAVRNLVPLSLSDSSEMVDGSRFIGSSEARQNTLRLIRRIAPSSSNVLITGETGTGKELIAALIHKNSMRSRAPFVAINCAAIPENLLESELFGYERGAFTGAHNRQPGKLRAASGGTIFLDELGDLTLSSQAKLLRAIETREIFPLGAQLPVAVDVRIVAATNQNLETLAEEGKFRKDLFFRLNVGRIRLAPLRARREDIPQIARHFVHAFNDAFGRNVRGFSSDAMERMVEYAWPGNVRELRNVVESAFLSSAGPWLETEDIAESIGVHSGSDTANQGTSERSRLIAALHESGWNKSEAARRLQWSRMTIYRKMVKYGLAEATDEAVTAATAE